MFCYSTESNKKLKRTLERMKMDSEKTSITYQILTIRQIVTLYRWPASRRFLCLFWRETRQRFFGLEISAWPEEVTGREKRVGRRKELTSSWRRDRGQKSWRRDSREASQQMIGSSEEDRVKMSAFQLLCGIFASNAC